MLPYPVKAGNGEHPFGQTLTTRALRRGVPPHHLDPIQMAAAYA
jgi:hypothetical protein